MQNSPKVSIIIPVYNTEKYIEKCLNSLVNQTLKDIEIIIINDGSTDNSIITVRNFANNDPRIKILNQLNQKQGAARNNGMKIAQGEYIGFVDSDDWVDLDYFEKLYYAAKQYNSDIALATNVRIGGGKTKKRLNIERVEYVSKLQDKIDIGKQPKNPCPTNKIYRASLLKEHNILFPERVYCEDKLFTIQAVYYANGIVTVPGINYYYFRNPNSTVNTRKIQHTKRLINDKRLAHRQVLDFLKSKIETDGAVIRDKDFWAIKYKKKILGFTLYQIKESINTSKFLLFGLIPLKEEVLKWKI